MKKSLHFLLTSQIFCAIVKLSIDDITQLNINGAVMELSFSESAPILTGSLSCNLGQPERLRFFRVKKIFKKYQKIFQFYFFLIIFES